MLPNYITARCLIIMSLTRVTELQHCMTSLMLSLPHITLLSFDVFKNKQHENGKKMHSCIVNLSIILRNDEVHWCNDDPQHI